MALMLLGGVTTFASQENEEYPPRKKIGRTLGEKLKIAEEEYANLCNKRDALAQKLSEKKNQLNDMENEKHQSDNQLESIKLLKEIIGYINELFIIAGEATRI
jgi:uncharacterized protein YlxW (UPF0749 family)